MSDRCRIDSESTSARLRRTEAELHSALAALNRLFGLGNADFDGDRDCVLCGLQIRPGEPRKTLPTIAYRIHVTCPAGES